MHLIT